MDGLSAEAPLGVSAYLEEVATLLAGTFGRSRQVWIRGEISKYYEKRHLYIDVKDASGEDAVLRVKCWESVWSPLKRQLADEGLVLKEGSVINFLGYVDVYKPRGEMSVTITKVDVHSLLGDAALQMQELLKRLTAEGVFAANKQHALSPLPLRVGLVGSPNTEGFKDFLGQLDRSEMAFAVTVVPTTVQGDAAPPAIINAIRTLDQEDLDVICLIRGGGSKADLSCFDDEGVARAIAASSRPVLTGIGHTGDRSVADMAAHTAAVTPTELGAMLASTARDFYHRNVTLMTERLSTAVSDVIAEASQFVQSARREILSTARNRLAAEQQGLRRSGVALVRAAQLVVDHSAERLTSIRQLLTAYDPQRRLEQGWSIVTDARGTVVKSATSVAPGEQLSVRVRDGVITTVVLESKE